MQKYKVEQYEIHAQSYLIEADSEAEAIAIAQQCPGLEYGCVVEVRPVAEQCGLAERAASNAFRAREIAGAATASATS